MDGSARRLGTGSSPRRHVRRNVFARGIPNALDSIVVKHGGGIALAKHYGVAGLNMSENAQPPDRAVSVEAGLTETSDRMQTGRLRVFNTLLDGFEESPLCHRKDGQVAKLRHDLISATHYSAMMIRDAPGIH